MKVLSNFKIVSLCVNLPGPLTAHQLQSMGAQITKIEPPGGDPLFHALPEFYNHLHQNQKILKLDLKAEVDREKLNNYLKDADLLLTSSRLDALARLNLDWD